MVIRVLHVGLGPIGAGVVRQVASRKGLQVNQYTLDTTTNPPAVLSGSVFPTGKLKDEPEFVPYIDINHPSVRRIDEQLDKQRGGLDGMRAEVKGLEERLRTGQIPGHPGKQVVDAATEPDATPEAATPESETPEAEKRKPPLAKSSKDLVVPTGYLCDSIAGSLSFIYENYPEFRLSVGADNFWFNWITDAGLGTLVKVDGSGSVLQTVTVGQDPDFPAFDGTNIWVPTINSTSVSVVRARSGRCANLQRMYEAQMNTRGLNKVCSSLSNRDPKDVRAANDLAATSMLLNVNLPAAYELLRAKYSRHWPSFR
jgi:hypothetical protein